MDDTERWDSMPLASVAQEIITKYEAENAALRTALAALTEADDAGLIYVEAGYGSDTYWIHECAFCGERGFDVATFTHAPDCPILAGRKLLGEG